MGKFLKKSKLVKKPSIITLFGSGETSPHMAKLYRGIINDFPEIQMEYPIKN